MTHANDNEELPFISLAALTANVVTYLQGNHQNNEDAAGNGDSTDTGKQDSSAEREYVDRYLRDIAAFERRARGEVIRKRKA